MILRSDDHVIFSSDDRMIVRAYDLDRRLADWPIGRLELWDWSISRLELACRLEPCFFRRFERRLLFTRGKYSTPVKNFKRPKNRKDSSDLDENLTESIAAMRSIISKIFVGPRAQKKMFSKTFSCDPLFEYLSLQDCRLIR